MLEAWFRNNQNYVNILNATDTCVKIDLVKRDIPHDELYYGNRKWGTGKTMDFFVVNQGMDFMSGEDYSGMEDISYGGENEIIIPGSWF